MKKLICEDCIFSKIVVKRVKKAIWLTNPNSFFIPKETLLIYCRKRQKYVLMYRTECSFFANMTLDNFKKHEDILKDEEIPNTLRGEKLE